MKKKYSLKQWYVTSRSGSSIRLFVFLDSAVFCNKKLWRTCSMGHKNVPNIVSLSHCLEQLFSCILTVIYVKAKKRRMRQCFREGHALYWKKMWFFVYFLSVCVLMRTWRFAVMSCVCPLINYTLATEENVRNVRVCACCNHLPITWNKFCCNTQLETISNIRTRYIFKGVLGKISAILPICIMKKIQPGSYV